MNTHIRTYTNPPPTHTHIYTPGCPESLRKNSHSYLPEDLCWLDEGSDWFERAAWPR